MKQGAQEGNVVQDFIIENTRVKICDDYCRNRTPQEVNEILKQIAATHWNPIRRER